MATGFDELIEFLLSEIALCGVQGAGSVDFRRFIQSFYDKKHVSGGLGRQFYEKVWDWVNNHGDVRIVYANETRTYSLSEFEALELQETGTNGVDGETNEEPHSSNIPQATSVDAPLAEDSFRLSLRQRLLDEGHAIDKVSAPRPTEALQFNVESSAQGHIDMSLSHEPVVPQQSTQLSDDVVALRTNSPDQAQPSQVFQNTRPHPKLRGRRKFPKGIRLTEPLFDDTSASTTAPRLYASQNRIWQAIAGHSIDLQRLPSMEFVLLSIIAAHGASGIIQPDLVRISKQDKRSVPHRTDMLAKKGYIEKKPIQAQKLRTSLCVHKKFVQEGHFLKGPGVVEDVFRDKTFILSGFADLLYNLLKNVGIVAMRDLRRKLGVSVQEWTPRSVRNAILRLNDTGFIKRVRARKKGSQDVFLVCIKLLRPPNEDDLKNLKFKRKVVIPEGLDLSTDPLESDEEGEALDRDLDLEVDSDDIDRIPPQWTPDRLIANLIHEATDISGFEGSDAAKLRDRTVGRFWKRPMEAYIGRLTDNWEQSQPIHLRHLALIRDTAVTTEKRFIHYVYHTYDNYQKAVDKGLVSWEGVSKEAAKNPSRDKRGRSKKECQDDKAFDPWGFLNTGASDFQRRVGTSTLAECRASIDRGPRQGPHWDNALAQEMGYEKHRRSGGNHKSTKGLTRTEVMTREDRKSRTEKKRIQRWAIGQASREANQNSLMKSFPTPPRARKKQPGDAPLLTKLQRTALGLPPRGRLGIDIEDQIRAHRKRTGDPTAIPATIIEESHSPRNAPLLSKEERATQGVSEMGRLPKALEDQIRQERVTAVAAEKPKKPRAKRGPKEPPLLTMEERIARGLPERGRLKQSVIDEILRERSIAGSSQPTEAPSITENNQAGYGREMTGVEYTSANEEPVHASPLIPTIIDQESANGRSEIASGQPSSPVTTTYTTSQQHDRSQTTLEDISVELQMPASEKGSATALNSGMSQSTTDSPVLASAKRKGDDIGQSSQPARKKVREGSSSPFIVGPRHKDLPLTAIEQPLVPSIQAPKPDSVDLNTRVQQIVAKFTQRPKPGVYINPFATRPIPRGRPKRALMAIFKSPRLRDMEWFQPDPIVVTKSLATGPVRRRKGRTTINPSAVIDLPASPTPNTEHQKDLAVAPGNEVNHVQLEESVVPPMEERQALIPVTDLPPRPSAWHPINSNMQRQSQTYQSPYAFTPIARPPVQTPTGTVTEGGSPPSAVSVNSTPAPETPAATEEEHDVPTTPEVRTVGYSRVKLRNADLKCGVLRGRGNVWRLRASIILEIIFRCNGLYPGDGELTSPFFTLWDQRAAKNMIRPDRSTLKNTLKSMLSNSEYKLKRLVFILPNMTGATTMERSIIAFTNVTPTDPKVKALQQSMMRVHPKKYYPPEISDLVLKEPAVRVQSIIEIDNSVEVNGMYLPTAGKLDQRILTSARNRKTAKDKKKKKSVESRKKIAEVEIKLLKRDQSRVGDRAKTVRLATLNEGPERYRRGTARPRAGGPKKNRDPSPARSDTSEDIPLSILRPLEPRSSKVQLIDEGHDDENSSSEEETTVRKPLATLLDPEVRFYSSNGTFSTEFTIEHNSQKSLWLDPIKTASNFLRETVTQPEGLRRTRKGRKRVRIAVDATRPRKKHRFESQFLDSSDHDKHTDHDEDVDPRDDDDYVSESSSDDEDDAVRVRPRRQAYHPCSNKAIVPTLVQRLTGLTGNSNDPPYVPPVRKDYRKQPKHWTLKASNNERQTKKIIGNVDSDNKFKKLCFTFIIASCMSSEDGSVDWNIVTNVYSSDKTFDLSKSKKTWSWMQSHMSSKLEALSSTFQSSFLEAYEKGKVESIEDPATYDWASLVQWALRNCKYPEAPLPIDRATLDQYEIEESSYETFTRVDWYRKDLSHVARTQRLLHCAYASPLHPQADSKSPTIDDVSRARAWIRANTATPEGIYDGNFAHEKLSALGTPTLERSVSSLVGEGVLRMRKVKRLLPGRNYNFMAALALQFRRAFEVEDFIDAANFKKSLDASFAKADTENRNVTISRTANNGAVMALLSLVNEGRVKLLPKLPPVNNAFNAPLPRLSVWGFSEGNYVHRTIDRNRLFWDIDVEPTSTYQFGNPLEPSPFPPRSSIESGVSAAWLQPIEPPLPGKHDMGALLPIWSSIDGQTVTWPWWNRILSLVLQSIIYQPGTSVAEIHRSCPTGTAELFEVDLVVSWLLQVGAVQSTTSGTFEIKPSFWAAFGDTMIDNEDDWFGKHVKRKKATSARWREQYNRRFATLNGDAAGQLGAMSEEPEEPDVRAQDAGGGQTTISRILSNPKRQYRVVKEVVDAPAASIVPSPVQSDQEDVVMVDSDVNTDDEDMDAEGEPDDEML